MNVNAIRIAIAPTATIIADKKMRYFFLSRRSLKSVCFMLG